MEVETIYDGVVGKLLVPAGAENVPVNTVIAILIDDAGESIAGASITDDSIADVAVAGNVAPENVALVSAAPESAAPATVSAPAITDAAEISGASTVLTVRESLRDAMAEEMRRDERVFVCLLYTSPSPRDGLLSRMPSSA